MGDDGTPRQPRRAPGRETGLALGLPLGFVLLAIVLYAPVLVPGVGFVWDDDAELWGTRGQLVQADDGPLRAWWPIERPEAGWHRVDAWRPVPGTGAWPLTPTVLWAEWRLFGADEAWAAAPDRTAAIRAVTALAWRFHWPNVLLHALAAYGLVLVLRRLRVPGATAVGLVFLVHPLCVPSVAWVSELKNGLSLAWMLASVWLYLLWDERRAAALYGLSLSAFGLSLAAKSAGVGLPVVLIALAFWRRRRIEARDARAVAPFVAVAAVSALLTLWFTAESGGLVALGPAPRDLVGRIALAAVVPWFYLGKTFVPTGLTMIYPDLRASPSDPLVGLALVATLGLATWAWRTRRGAGAPLWVSGVVFAALIAPVLGLFRMTYAMHAPVADHLAYAALTAPLAGAIGSAAAWVAPRSRATRRVALALLILVAAGLGLATHGRARHWTDHVALWRHNVVANPDAWMAQYNLGSALALEAEDLAEGPARTRALEEAAEHLDRAATLEPRYTLAHYRRAQVWQSLGREDGALDALRDAVAAAVAGAGPGSVEAAMMHAELARALARRGDLAEARHAYEASLAVLPDRPATLAGLAEVLERLGDDAGAAARYETLLAAYPAHRRALVGLAWLRSSSPDVTVRRPAAAARLADRALRATGRSAAALRLRAREARLAADAELAWLQETPDGRARAIALARETLAVARATGRPRSVEAASARLARFGVPEPEPGAPPHAAAPSLQ